MDNEGVIKRVMPHNLEAEQSVIASMLMDRDAIVVASETLVKDDFYHQVNGTLFEAMLQLFNAGEAVDVVTLQNKLRENNVPPEVSSLEYIGAIVSAVPTSANVRYYANIVKDKAVLRRMIHAMSELESRCYADSEELPVLLDDTEKNIFKIIQESRGSRDFVDIRDIVLNTLKKIEKVAKAGGNVTGIPTGFTDLDRMTAGMQPSDLVLVAARPSMGKTAFVLNIAQHTAFRKNICTAIFSLEMSKEQLVNRMLSMESHIDAQVLRTGDLKPEDWETLVEGASVIGNSQLIIDDTPAITVQELRSKCRKFKLDKNLQLVIIDYLQLMSGSGRGSDSRQQEISDISRALKSLARELEVPVVALSQLSRAPEQRPDHRPMLSDLRESGAIEQDADVVMFIYRDEYYHKDTEKPNTAEIIIAKQRNGPIGTVDLTWLAKYTRFANIQR